MNKGIAQHVAVVWHPQVSREGAPPRGPESRSSRMPGLRESAAHALDDDWPAVLAAPRRGLEDKDARKAAQVAVSLSCCYSRASASRPTKTTSGSC
jgi:hypothetical protein